MAEIFSDLQICFLILAGPSILWIIAGTFGGLFALSALIIALRLLRRFV